MMIDVQRADAQCPARVRIPHPRHEPEQSGRIDSATQGHAETDARVGGQPRGQEPSQMV